MPVSLPLRTRVLKFGLTPTSGLINGGDAAIPAFSNALKDSDAPVRFQAVQTLGAMGLPKAVQALTNALEDQHEKVPLLPELFLIL